MLNNQRVHVKIQGVAKKWPRSSTAGFHVGARLSHDLSPGQPAEPGPAVGVFQRLNRQRCGTGSISDRSDGFLDVLGSMAMVYKVVPPR